MGIVLSLSLSPGGSQRSRASSRAPRPCEWLHFYDNHTFRQESKQSPGAAHEASPTCTHAQALRTHATAHGGD